MFYIFYIYMVDNTNYYDSDVVPHHMQNVKLYVDKPETPFLNILSLTFTL